MIPLRVRSHPKAMLVMAQITSIIINLSEDDQQLPSDKTRFGGDFLSKEDMYAN